MHIRTYVAARRCSDSVLEVEFSSSSHSATKAHGTSPYNGWWHYKLSITHGQGMLVPQTHSSSAAMQWKPYTVWLLHTLKSCLPTATPLSHAHTYYIHACIHTPTCVYVNTLLCISYVCMYVHTYTHSPYPVAVCFSQCALQRATSVQHLCTLLLQECLGSLLQWRPNNHSLYQRVKGREKNDTKQWKLVWGLGHMRKHTYMIYTNV